MSELDTLFVEGQGYDDNSIGATLIGFDKFVGIISRVKQTIYIISIESKYPNSGNFTMLINKIHSYNMYVKIWKPNDLLKSIIRHKGFVCGFEDFWGTVNAEVWKEATF